MKFLEPVRVPKETKERKIFDPTEYRTHLEEKTEEDRKLAELQQ